LVESNADIEV